MSREEIGRRLDAEDYYGLGTHFLRAWLKREHPSVECLVLSGVIEPGIPPLQIPITNAGAEPSLHPTPLVV